MAEPHVFWDKMAKRYAASAIRDQAAYETKLEKTRAYLTPESRVLEIACGTGSTALLHAPFVQHYLATDYSGAMIEIAKAKAAKAGVENVTFQCRAIAAIGPEDGPFDVVMAHSILHLLPDWQDVLVDVFDLVKPGGLFISSTPCMKSFTVLLRPLLTLGQWAGKVPALAYFSAADLQRGLIAAGFMIESTWQPKPRAAVFIVARRPLA